MRILVVEDEPRIAADVTAALAAAGYVADLSKDGENAWFRGDTEAYDLVIRDGEAWSLVKLDGGEESWRTLQDRYGDYKSSLGPFDLFDVLSALERDWPDLFFAHQARIRAFASSNEKVIEF